jgi:hypothetical protein
MNFTGWAVRISTRALTKYVLHSNNLGQRRTNVSDIYFQDLLNAFILIVITVDLCKKMADGKPEKNIILEVQLQEDKFRPEM